jgi:Tol biopolymer transport system component
MSSITSRRPSWARLAFALALLSFLALPSLAQAAFPGRNGKIAFASNRDGNSEIYVMNADGTAQTRITSNPAADSEPAWSPSGTKIAFESNRAGNSEIYVMNADGTGQTRITSNPADDFGPAWSPDGTRIAFASTRAETCCPYAIFTMKADGSDVTQLTGSAFALGGATQPAWSPNGTKIAFTTGAPSDVWVINADGTTPTRLTSEGFGSPNWSPDGTKIAFNSGTDVYTMNADGTGQTSITSGLVPAWSPDGGAIVFVSRADGDSEIRVFPSGAQLTHNQVSDTDPDWQPLQYPRPKGATPFRASLVVAFKSCTAPNRQHGPALAFPSCAPPVQESDWLTTGTADSNGQATEFVGSVRFVTLVGNPATPADEADVTAVMSITDVRTKTTMTDYAGELQANAVLRITDRNNAVPPGGGTDAATVVDIPFPVNASCAATADPLVGATCSASTSMDAIVPGAVKEGKRAVWQVGQVQVYDGGADGAVTTSPNTLFARQGVFVP